MKSRHTLYSWVTAATLSLLTGSACGGTILLPTSADAYIEANNPDANYGAAEVLAIGQDILGGHKAYLRFDASGWGATNIARIGEIRLAPASDLTRTYSAYVITGEGANDWTEAGITWNNAPANNVELFNRNFAAYPGQTVTLLGTVSGGGVGTNLTIPFGPGSAGEMALLNALNTGTRKVTVGIQYNSPQETTVGIYSREHEGGSVAAALAILPPDRVIPVAMDAHINWYYPDMNYGAAEVLAISQSSVGGQKAYLLFDASPLGETEVKRVEKLRVFWSGSVNITRTLKFVLLTGTGVNDWTETEITWHNAPANNTATDRNFLAYPGQTVTTLGSIPYTAANPREMNLLIAEGSPAETALLNALNTGDRKATIGVGYSSSQETTVGIYSREREGGIFTPSLWFGEKVPPSVRWVGFSANQPVLELAGPANVNYTILSSTNLTDWFPVETIIMPTPPFQWTDTFNSPVSPRFYRTRTE